MRLVAYCSRSLTKSERNYAQIEKELLASVWACKKFRIYIQGVEFVLQSDHKPLIPLINIKNLADAPVRCQRMLMRLARYSTTSEYVAGKYMVVADTLSKDIMGDGIYSEVEAKLAKEINEYSVQAIDSPSVSEPKLQQIIEQQELDNIIVRVKSYTRNGWPEGIDGELNYYWKERSYLGLFDDLLVFNDRIVIPSSMRR